LRNQLFGKMVIEFGEIHLRYFWVR
jgi:hypothetical protein